MSISSSERQVPSFTLGDRLRKARELTGLDRKQFAEHIGIHRDSIAKYETDRTRPRPPILAAWSMATHVDLEWIRGGAGPNTDPSDYKAPVSCRRGPKARTDLSRPHPRLAA